MKEYELPWLDAERANAVLQAVMELAGTCNGGGCPLREALRRVLDGPGR